MGVGGGLWLQPQCDVGGNSRPRHCLLDLREWEHARAWWLLLNGTLDPCLSSPRKWERIMGGEKGGMRRLGVKKEKMETLGGTQAQRNGHPRDYQSGTHAKMAEVWTVSQRYI